MSKKLLSSLVGSLGLATTLLLLPLTAYASPLMYSNGIGVTSLSASVDGSASTDFFFTPGGNVSHSLNSGSTSDVYLTYDGQGTLHIEWLNSSGSSTSMSILGGVSSVSTLDLGAPPTGDTGLRSINTPSSASIGV